LARQFAKLAEARVVAACDVDTREARKCADEVNKAYGSADCQTYGDFREVVGRQDIDAVIVATPDHWHALASIAAARAGKHIFCEKPLANSIGESKALRDAVKKAGVVLQTGSCERSRDNARYCCEVVRNGFIGKLHTMFIHLPTDQGHHDRVRQQTALPPAEQPPAELNYDFWLGHTPKIPYYTRPAPRQLALQPELRLRRDVGPRRARDRHRPARQQHRRHGAGLDRGQGLGRRARPLQRADVLRVREHLRQRRADDRRHHAQAPRRALRGRRRLDLPPHSRGHARGLRREAPEARPASFKVQLGRTSSHEQNFIDAVKRGIKPFADVEVGHRSCTACLVNMMAMRLKRKLTWDPKAEQFVGDDEANRLMTPAMRAPWSLA
jgi:hypothetical protein